MQKLFYLSLVATGIIVANTAMAEMTPQASGAIDAVKISGSPEHRLQKEEELLKMEKKRTELRLEKIEDALASVKTQRVAEKSAEEHAAEDKGGEPKKAVAATVAAAKVLQKADATKKAAEETVLAKDPEKKADKAKETAKKAAETKEAAEHSAAVHKAAAAAK